MITNDIAISCQYSNEHKWIIVRGVRFEVGLTPEYMGLNVVSKCIPKYKFITP